MTFLKTIKGITQREKRINDKQAQLDDPLFNDKVAKGNFFTGKKNYAEIKARFTRIELPFEYDEKTKVVSITL